MKNPFTLIRSFFAKQEKIKAAKIEAEIVNKPEEQIKEEKNLFYRPQKTGTKYRIKSKIKTKWQIEADRRKKKKKLNRIQKQSRIINRKAA